MKKVIFLTLIIAGILACQSNQENGNESKKTGSLDDSVKMEKIFNEFKTLYNELLTFKDKADFKEYGFGAGGPYNNWLKRVEKLENDPDSDLLLKKGVLVGELQPLGMAYASSKGKETEVTREFNKTFKDAILSKPVENAETKSGNTNYKKIQAEYELFGRWKITNSTINESYTYEIYEKGNDFIGVIPQGEYNTEKLDKQGDKYFVKGNKEGEYYKIDSEMNMSLFDKDGELASVGYEATKLD